MSRVFAFLLPPPGGWNSLPQNSRLSISCQFSEPPQSTLFQFSILRALTPIPHAPWLWLDYGALSIILLISILVLLRDCCFKCSRYVFLAFQPIRVQSCRQLGHCTVASAVAKATFYVISIVFASSRIIAVISPTLTCDFRRRLNSTRYIFASKPCHLPTPK